MPLRQPGVDPICRLFVAVALMCLWSAGGRLSLWVDGRRVAESAPFPAAGYNLDCEAPLRLGAGEWGTFRGSLADVRLYRHALAEGEIARLATHDRTP